MKAATYLEFELNAEEVIECYKDVFDAEVILSYRYDQHMTADAALVGKIFHAELKIGDLNLYLADTNRVPAFASIKFVVEFSNPEKAHLCFGKLANTGQVISDFEQMPFGPQIASVLDPFGMKWDIVIC
jgi:uncharacterized glyoxalase superfamily protein PhnB